MSSKKGQKGRGKGAEHNRPTPLQERRDVQRPAWDYTSSDMNKYRLSSAQQLRRQLLRISRHHDEAAEEVHQKLKEMQENLAPYVGDQLSDLRGSFDAGHSQGRNDGVAGGLSNTSSSCLVKPRNLSPCFASRVSTGRIPDKVPEGRQQLDRQIEKRFYRKNTRAQVEEDMGAVDGADAGYPDAHLEAALESEIEGFFRTSSPSVAAASKPQYRLQRKGASKKETEHFSTFLEATLLPMLGLPEDEAHSHISLQQSSASSDWSELRNFVNNGIAEHSFQESEPALQRISSEGGDDIELFDIEHAASQLQAQLQWWRKQEAQLLAQDATRAATEELSGMSEWLQIPSSSPENRTWTSPGGSRGDRLQRHEDIPTWSTPSPSVERPASFADMATPPRVSPEVPRFRQAWSSVEDDKPPLPQGMSLSRLIAKQAEDLEHLHLHQLDKSGPPCSDSPGVLAATVFADNTPWAASGPDASLVAPTKLRPH